MRASGAQLDEITKLIDSGAPPSRSSTGRTRSTRPRRPSLTSKAAAAKGKVVITTRGVVMRLDLPGRTVVITGASGGLGAGLAPRASRSRRERRAARPRRRSRAPAGRTPGRRPVRARLVDRRPRPRRPSSRSWARSTEHFGAIDVVVAGAGVLGTSQTIDVTSAADWDRVIDINLNGAWRTLKAAAPHVDASHGHMVAVSSMIAYVHPPLLASYAASKAGVAALCDVLRLEMRPAA